MQKTQATTKKQKPKAKAKSATAPKRAAKPPEGASKEVSPVYGADGERLQALRASDPQKSLQERWRVLSGHRNATELGYVPHVIEHGWAVTAVPEDRVIYTIGLHYRFGQRELLIASPDAATPEGIAALKALLNEIGHGVSGGARIGAGDTVNIGGRKLTFNAYEDADFDRYPCGYLARFDELLDDTFHTRGGTLPALWAVDEGAPKAKAKPGKKKG